MAQRIRVFLMQFGEGSPQQFYEYSGKKYKLMTILRYFHILRFLELIELSWTRPNRKHSPIYENIYRIVDGKEAHPCWNYPWWCYWEKKGRLDRIPQTFKITGEYPWRTG